jgi:hypothetical protein
LAFSLGWGITFSTLMTLFALPALLEIREDLFSVQGKILGLVFSSKIKTIDIEEQKARLKPEEKERIPELWKNIRKDNDEKIGPRQ